MLPILKLVATRELTNKACVESIADQFSLSPEEREQLLPSGKQTIIANRTHWAATYMMKAGLIDRPRRGTLIATGLGRQIVSQNLPRIDNKFLEQFQGWLLLDSRGVDVSMASNPTFVSLSSLRPLFFTSPENELRSSDNTGA